MNGLFRILSSAWAKARRAIAFFASGRRRARDNDEQGILLNRLTLALTALFIAELYARFDSPAAQNYLYRGLPWVEAYIVLIGLTQAHLALQPAPHIARRIISICADAAFVSGALWAGGAAAAYLAPIYFWMILGYGVRFGAAYMGVAVGSSALGFAIVVAWTPFWQANAALSAGLFFSLIVIPAYGAILLGRLNDARAAAERANRAKTLLLANVSHELRTPLTAILGLGGLLQKTELNEPQREMVRTIAGAGEILLRHIEALLKASRDEIGRAAPQLEQVDLFALLLSLRGLLAVEAEKKGLRLGLSIDATTPRHVLAEPGLLLDILQNLGGNAVKFTPFGAVSIHVGAAPRAGGDVLLRFEVRDTGVGVPKAAQEQIFETFVQAGPDIAPRFGGSGLGLAIARRRLAARGGRIGVESDIGKGSMFWFELSAPRAEAPPPPGESFSVPPALRFDALDAVEGQRIEPACVIASAPFDALELAWEFAFCVVARKENQDEIAMAQRKTGWLRALLRGAPAIEERSAPRLDGRRVLLAEDNGVNRKILTAILAGGGCDVTAVEDGHAALEAMLAGTFDLVLLDLNLPKITGLDVARLYRFGRPGAAGRAPVVALTADASPERQDECREAGMERCLTKPIGPDALLAAVAEALSAHETSDTEERRKALAASAPPVRDPAVRDAVLASSALDALVRLGGEGFLREVVDQFLTEGGELVERMGHAVEGGDLAAFRHDAHAFESSAGNVGVVALAALCRSWRGLTPEAFALYGDDYLDDLRRVWAEADAALAAALARRAAAGDRRGRGVAA